MALDESLNFDIDEALRAIDTIESALGASATSFKVALADALDVLGTVTVGEVDAGSVTSSIDAAVAASDTTPVIEADASGITGEVDAAVGAADATAPVGVDGAAITDEISAAAANADATVTVTADTSEAESAISDLGSAATESGGGLETLKGGVEALGVSAALGRGEVASLAEGARGLGGGAEVAAGGVLAVGATLGEFFNKALQADTASRRFALTAGDMAESIDRVQIGGLNESLDTLTLRTGNSRVAMELANAKIVQLGQSSGASNPQIEETAKQLDAVAIHATTVNPTLGDAGAAAERLTAAFARGGRALVPFGIALSSSEINARALADTGKSTAAELTIFEKAAAGVAITTERLGTTLGSDVNTGAQSAEIRLRSLKEEFDRAAEAFGKPLLEPVIAALRDIQPVLIEVGGDFGKLGAEALPLVVKALEVVAPLFSAAAGAIGVILDVLGPIIGLFDAIPTPALTAVAAVIGIAKAIDAITLAMGTVEAVGGIGAIFEAGTAALVGFLNPVTLAAVAVGGLVAVLTQGSDAEDAHRKAVERATQAYGDNTKSVQENTAALANQAFAKSADELNRLGLTIDQVTHLADQGRSGYQQFLDTLASSGRITATERDALGRSTEGIGQFLVANQAMVLSQGGLSNSTVDLIGSFQQFAQTSQEGAKNQLALAQAHGQVTAEQVKSAEAQHQLNGGGTDYIGVLDQLIPKQSAVAAGGRDMASSTQQQTEAVDGLGRALKDVLAAEEDQIQKELGLSNASLAAESAAQSRQRAEADLAKAIAEHGQGSQEAQAADLALRQAQESQTEALVRLAGQNRDTTVAQLENSGASVDAATKSEIYKQNLIDLANTVEDPMRTQILGLANDIKSVPPSSNTTINVDAAAALDKLQQTHIAIDAIPEEKLVSIAVQVFGAEHAQDILNQLKSDTGNLNLNLGPGHMAGGPVEAGVSTFVGEVEPEILVPRLPGVIGNQNQLRAAIASEVAAQVPHAAVAAAQTVNHVVVNEVAQDPEATAFAIAARLGQLATR